MERTITVTEAARNFSEVVNCAYYKGETTILLRSGQPVAKISPVGPMGCTGAWLADRLSMVSHLSAEGADAFADDVEVGRSELNTPPSPSWD